MRGYGGTGELDAGAVSMLISGDRSGALHEGIASNPQKHVVDYFLESGLIGQVAAPARKLGKTSPLRCRSRTCPAGVVQQLAPRRGRATLPVAYPSAAIAETYRAKNITALSRLAYSLGDACLWY